MALCPVAVLAVLTVPIYLCVCVHWLCLLCVLRVRVCVPLLCALPVANMLGVFIAPDCCVIIY